MTEPLIPAQRSTQPTRRTMRCTEPIKEELELDAYLLEEGKENDMAHFSTIHVAADRDHDRADKGPPN